jgi:hypothetical protein
MVTMPVSTWFIFRQDAAIAYLAQVLREIRWKTSADPLVERLGLALKGDLVRVVENNERSSCHCGCRNYFPRCKKRGRPSIRCLFWFEMDQGRPGMGHQYIMEVGSDAVSVWQVGSSARADLGHIEDLSPDDVLKCIREIVVDDIMGQ